MTPASSPNANEFFNSLLEPSRLRLAHSVFHAPRWLSANMPLSGSSGPLWSRMPHGNHHHQDKRYPLKFGTPTLLSARHSKSFRPTALIESPECPCVCLRSPDTER